MEETIYVCRLGKVSGFLEEMIAKFTDEFDEVKAGDIEHIGNCKGKKFLFAIELEELGVNLDIEPLVQKIYKSKDKDQLKYSAGVILIHSKEDLYTKSVSSMLVFRLNSMGMQFPGRPMVEAPRGLKNYISPQLRNGKSLEENCLIETKDLAHRFKIYDIFSKSKEKPKILALHASEEGSNTLYLWNMVKENLEGLAHINEIYIPNGEVKDCEGCSYTVCKYFAKQKSCYYGGIMVEEVYPEIIEADILVMLCPNYNDALGANLTAIINRLTALFRHTKFYDKKLYSIVVSGSSGSEAIAAQLIRALNMNKTFQLPPDFSLSAIANDRGSIFQIEDIEKRAMEFSKRICSKM
ncbi:flavodoxin family protein [Proteocatella sphenisci]|uniref:flavodoxin family protein n=1 Tax=Proteocatella sphenisci TaxID=181070 RepID=UPI000491E517|nr:NAD(P)H-dependent oxidoreductase [Proteocatella sphenisci]